MKTEIDIKPYIEQTKQNGKFELENPLTPYLWELSLNGDHGEILTCHENDSHYAEKVELTCEDWEAFNGGDEDFPFTWILVEDSQGFVMTMKENDYNIWKS